MLSGWTDREALDAFVRSPAHRRAMTALRPTMASSLFTDWEADPTAAPDWAGAADRLAAQRR